MRLIRTVVVKHVLTEKKKSQIIQQFEEEFIQNKREIEQLTFQLHRALRNSTEQEQQKIRASYNKDLNHREEKLEVISFKLTEMQKLKIGMEIQGGKVERIIDVAVGDSWPSKDQEAEIIIKDGIIHEIREGRYNDDRLV